MVKVQIGNLKWEENDEWLENLKALLDAMKDNDDLLLIFTGPERAGKSTRMRQVAKFCAWYMGSHFSGKNIHQNLNSYIDFSIEAPKYTPIILDEARQQLSRKRATSKEVQKFTNYLSECGMYNQIHLIALPAYHDLDRNVVLWRSKGVINVHKNLYKPKNSDRYKLFRGRYSFHINDKELKKYYEYPYNYPKKPAVKGEFDNVEVLTDQELQEYEENKMGNIEERYHTKHEEQRLNKTEQMWKNRCMNLCMHLEDARGIKPGEIADAMGIEVKKYYDTKTKMGIGRMSKEDNITPIRR